MGFNSGFKGLKIWNLEHSMNAGRTLNQRCLRRQVAG